MGLKTKLRRYLSPRAYLRRLVQRRSGLRVLAGPFEGMNYVTESHGAAYIPKIVGCYERELYDVVEEVIAGGHDLMVDVGAAEGYYAVGFAMRCDTPIIAFEMSPTGRALATEVAEKNGVSGRIDLRGECQNADLEAALSGAQQPFVLVDVEGFEARLLDLQTVPALRRATVLVEIHEPERPGITADLLHRFSDTHEIRVVWDDARSADEYPYQTVFTRMMPERFVRRAVEENRAYKQSWLWMKPRDANASRAAA